MKRFIAIAAAAVTMLGGVLAYLAGSRSNAEAGMAPSLEGASASVDVLARGEYLSRAADCIACHTAPGGKPYAGGLAFKLPFGTIYSSNITSDKTYGIGGWSDEQFVRAVREGVGADGRHLYPAFPYTSYTQLSRQDVLAIKAYLFSLPAEPHPDRPADLRFPFNQRWAMAFWKALFFDNERFEFDARKSSEWNRGAYLAVALGHCGECHTPRNSGFGLQSREELAGADLQGWRAYNITSDPAWGIGAWSEAEIAAYLSSGHAQGRGTASGPMAEAIGHSLRYLTAGDMEALVAYLREVPPRRGNHPVKANLQPEKAISSSTMLPAAEDEAYPRGRELFAGDCAGCHAWNGQGRQITQAALLGTRGVADPSGLNVAQVVLFGTGDFQGNGILMPGFASAYSDEEVAEVVNFVLAHFGGVQGRMMPGTIAKLRIASHAGEASPGSGS